MPPEGGEISIDEVRTLVSMISDFIPIHWLSMDRYQSASTLQYFRSKGVGTSIISVDRSPEPYIETKFAVKESRVLMARHLVIEEEMPLLDQDNITGRVDHPETGSKDVSDALAGALFNLSTKRSSHRKKGEPKVLPLSIPIVNKAKSTRPTSGRPSLY